MSDQPIVYDLGDVVTLGAEVRDSAGTLANAGAVTLTVILPDGSSVTPLVTNPSTGVYSAAITATQVGYHVEKWTATGANAAAWRDSFTVADDALIPVIGLDEAKAFLQITSGTSDEELRVFIAAAAERIEAEVARVLGRRTVVHTFTKPMGAVTFPGVPILSVTSVVDGDKTLAATDYILSAQSGVIVPKGAWESDTLTVTAVCGLVSPPEPVRHSILLLLEHMWQTQRGTMRMGIGGDDWSPSMTFTLPNRARENLIPYKIPGFG